MPPITPPTIVAIGGPAWEEDNAEVAIDVLPESNERGLVADEREGIAEASVTGVIVDDPLCAD